MSEAQREPCPCCGEPAALFAKVCPFCAGSLLVDVALSAPVSEPGTRYRLAREISSFGAPAYPFSEVRQALGTPRPVLARGASRMAALHLVELLADLGLQATIEPAGATASPRGDRGLAAAGLAAVVLLAILATSLGLRPQDGSADLPAVRHPTRGAVQAKTPSWPTPAAPLSARDLGELAAPALVRLRSGDHIASGFLVAPQLALTRTSAVPDGTAFQVLLADGREVEGEVVKRDVWLGLALVRVPEAGSEALQLGDAAAARSGDRVVLPGALPGAPLGPRPRLREAAIGTDAWQLQGIAYLSLSGTLEPVGPEADGGPVLDARGRVLGVVVVRGDGAYLLPINYAYEESKLIEPPRPAPDPRPWKALLAQVETAEALRAGAREGDGRP